MKAHIEKTNLVIDYLDLFAGLSEEEKLYVADSLSREDDIIKFVVQQILTGWTEQGSSGGRACSWSKWQRGIDLAITEISKVSGEIAAREIERLHGEMARLAKQRDDLTHRLYSLRHDPKERGICEVSP